VQRFTVSLPDDVAAGLEGFAGRERRSLSGAVALLLERALACDSPGLGEAELPVVVDGDGAGSFPAGPSSFKPDPKPGGKRREA
jgi:hypothetical protein